MTELIYVVTILDPLTQQYHPMGVFDTQAIAVENTEAVLKAMYPNSAITNQENFQFILEGAPHMKNVVGIVRPFTVNSSRQILQEIQSAQRRRERGF
jgi:hypothetical protein